MAGLKEVADMVYEIFIRIASNALRGIARAFALPAFRQLPRMLVLHQAS
ncbi:hypothetical protein [Pseudomonas huaxiensis]|nr:hypothetical protein [Pseudomonas huaxiensis]